MALAGRAPLRAPGLLASAIVAALFAAAAPTRAAEGPAIPAHQAAPACPLGEFHCAPRPPNYAMCRPNALLEFYDPALPTDPSRRATSATHISAQSVNSSNRAIYRLAGNVRIARADQLVQADAAQYDDQTTDYAAHGNVRYQEAGQLLAADRLHGNSDAGTGVASDVRYQMLGARGNGTATQGTLEGPQRSRFLDASYSTCDPGHHIWEFRARSIRIDQGTGVGVARDATLRVGNTPILYLPYFSFPTDDRRKSGFLYPVLAHSSRYGYEISTPYYLNLAPNYDATLDPRVYTGRGVMLGGEFRYLVPGSHGTFAAQYVPDDHGEQSALAATSGTSRYLVGFTDDTHLAGSWNLHASINRTSDSSYLYDFANTGQTATVYSLASTVRVGGSGTWWDAAFGGTSWQNTNPFLTDAVLPYRQLPYATLRLDFLPLHWLELGMRNAAVAFRKPGFIEGERADLVPFAAASFGGPAWFVRPRVEYRYTAYQLDGNYGAYGYYGLLGSGAASPFTSKSPSRALPVASIDSGLVFERATSLFGQPYTQTLEPRLYYLYVPYRDQDRLPLFDTNLMGFDYWQLFSTNQYSGADRQMNANNLTGAITTRFLDADGAERLSASFGQIRYFTPQRVQLPTGQNSVAPATDWSGSDYVAQVDAQISERWRISSTYQWNPATRRRDMAALRVQHRLADSGLINFSYYYRRGLLEQYNASAVYPLSERWRLFAALAWSVPDHLMVEALGGVQYDSCCVTLRLAERSYVNQGYFGYGPASQPTNLNRRDNAVMFEVIFKGLGSSGGQIDALLQRDILGYQ